MVLVLWNSLHEVLKNEQVRNITTGSEISSQAFKCCILSHTFCLILPTTGARINLKFLHVLTEGKPTRPTLEIQTLASKMQ